MKNNLQKILIYNFIVLCENEKIFDALNYKIQSSIINSMDNCAIITRHKGINTNFGKIIKGCIKDATTKISIGSIPSSFQSVVYKTNRKKGFGSSQTRFKSTQIIKSQSITAQQTQASQITKKNSDGAFLSKTQKFLRKIPGTPGPGQYSHQYTQAIKIRRKFKTRKNQRQFRNTIIQNDQVPGPGHYYNMLDQQHPGWKCSFKTKVQRNGYVGQSCSPGPGHYYQKTYKKNKKNAKIIVKQCKQNQNTINKLLRRAIQNNKLTAQLPGPGTYEQNIPDFKPFYQKIKVSKNFILSHKNRFGQNQQDFYIDEGIDRQISPCSYNIKSKFDDLKEIKLIHSPFFMSETARIPFQADKQNYGPNFIPFEKFKKYNFHFNIRKNWL